MYPQAGRRCLLFRQTGPRSFGPPGGPGRNLIDFEVPSTGLNAAQVADQAQAKLEAHGYDDFTRFDVRIAGVPGVPDYQAPTNLRLQPSRLRGIVTKHPGRFCGEHDVDTPGNRCCSPASAPRQVPGRRCRQSRSPGRPRCARTGSATGSPIRARDTTHTSGVGRRYRDRGSPHLDPQRRSQRSARGSECMSPPWRRRRAARRHPSRSPRPDVHRWPEEDADKRSGECEEPVVQAAGHQSSRPPDQIGDGHERLLGEEDDADRAV